MTPPSVRPDSTSNGPVHFAYIDAVRGLAFLGVIVVHCALLVGHFPGQSLLGEGGYGVQLFFLASAITLCSSVSSRSRIDPYPILFFYLRRIFRIAPLFWIAMAVYWLVPSIIPRIWLTEWAPNGVHTNYFVLTALFLHGWHPYTFNSIVPGGWSIAVEMNFYLLFPLLFRIFGRSLRRSIVAVLASLATVALLVHAMPWIRYHLYPGVADAPWSFFRSLWLPMQIPVFLIGFLTYHLLRNPVVSGLMKDRFWASSLLFFCALIILTVFTRRDGGLLPGYLFVVMAFSGSILAISQYALDWIVTGPLCYLGKISYSCYLAHFAALALTLRLLHLHLTPQAPIVDTNHALGNLLLFGKLLTITLGITTVIASIALRLIEEPGIGLGKLLLKHIAAYHDVKTISS